MHTLIIKAEAGLMPGIDILPIGPGKIRQRFMKAASSWALPLRQLDSVGVQRRDALDQFLPL